MAFRLLSIFILAAVAVSAKTLKFACVNIAGGDFGCGTDGTCNSGSAYIPLATLGGPDGLGQMQHFVKDDGYNMFRLPTSFQYLTGNQMSGVLNTGLFNNYVELVEACLSTGAYCIIDMHNYARFDGQIIGQSGSGGPTNEMFAGVWSSVAEHWKDEPHVVFGLMNEPHDIPDIEKWAETLQAAVTAIRSKGATSQMILLSGTNYMAASSFISSGSADALLKVKNPDGSTTNLIMDVHQYLDSDNSGTNTECVTNNIDNAWKPLSTWLRANNRQALNTETGGGNVQSCVTYLQQQIAYQAQNSDVILGYCGWGAGSFDTSYVLSQTPTKTGSEWQDTLTVSGAMSPKKNNLVSTRAC